MQHPIIGIFGNGFSGIIATYELINQSAAPLTVIVFDPSIYSGYGIAYSTNCPLHLLNVPIKKMSALSKNPDHLFDWLQTYSHIWRSLHPSFLHLNIHPDLFLPRMIYGRYLRHVVKITEEIAKYKGMTIHRYSDTIFNIERNPSGELEAIAQSGMRYPIDFGILATGIPWTHSLKNPDMLNTDTGYLEAPWPILTNLEAARKWLASTHTSTHIAVIGSGLTMLDALSSLHAVNYQGKITVISHKGLLPHLHDPTLSPVESFLKTSNFPNTALNLFKLLRAQASSLFGDMPADWRPIIDSLRPFTCQIWAQFPIQEKQRIFRHLFNRWNIFRHRSPSAPLALLRCYEQEKRLNILHASVNALQRGNNQHIDVHLSHSETHQSFINTYERVINCTGPRFDVKNQHNLLINNLMQKDMILLDCLGLGLELSGLSLASKTASNRLFALGALLFGTNFETLAVPEIRQQCQEVAEKILHNSYYKAKEGSEKP